MTVTVLSDEPGGESARSGRAPRVLCVHLVDYPLRLQAAQSLLDEGAEFLGPIDLLP
jgi:hypothetical protein